MSRKRKYRVVITITKELGSLWGDDDYFAAATDGQIIELVQEDIIEFLDNATWKVSVTHA